MTRSEFFFSFKGRINRSKYWFYILCVVGSFACLALIGGLVEWVAGSHAAREVVLGVGLVFYYPLLIWTALAVNVKRSHDLGYSGWFVLVGPIPIIGLIYGIPAMFFRGTVGPNEYGPDPLEEKKPVDAQATVPLPGVADGQRGSSSP